MRECEAPLGRGEEATSPRKCEPSEDERPQDIWQFRERAGNPRQPRRRGTLISAVARALLIVLPAATGREESCITAFSLSKQDPCVRSLIPSTLGASALLEHASGVRSSATQYDARDRNYHRCSLLRRRATFSLVRTAARVADKFPSYTSGYCRGSHRGDCPRASPIARPTSIFINLRHVRGSPGAGDVFIDQRAGMNDSPRENNTEKQRPTRGPHCCICTYLHHRSN